MFGLCYLIAGAYWRSHGTFVPSRSCPFVAGLSRILGALCRVEAELSVGVIEYSLCFLISCIADCLHHCNVLDSRQD